MTEMVQYERDSEGIGWLTIDRPNAANSLNEAARGELWTCFEAFRDDTEAGALVITGTGEKAFCAGGDLKEMASSVLRVPSADFIPQLNRNFSLDKPVIAAVNGVALGGGFLLAQMADLCVAADHATFAISEAKWGRGAPWAAPLPWMIPPRVALEILLTGERISAQRGYELGFVNRVVPMEELKSTVVELARRIMRNAPLSVRASKAMVYASNAAAVKDAFAAAEQLFEKVYMSDDAQEGPRAFGESRPPRWTGR
ncbi:enoyl-CoA hydratase-related protein [Agromyces bauzanensis]|uniref:Enoyl-CoA dehydratase/isomerase n=1 Tax=Agromyces bauzanensis TaxID=1308924 RepID=A0A917PTJ9_9MICO|nr:enoyl-CoA hydratase-related protein [Agromyces bauzanensis]GGJ90968.1 putative enoyl-CoA dehydratase/isomerase [Agromyces bauzanensis]